ALMRLQRDNEIVLCEEIPAAPNLWQRMRRQGIGIIYEAAKRQPGRLRPELAELRAALRDQPQNVFDALVAELCTDDFVRKGPAIARTSHRPLLSAELPPDEAKIR